MKVFRKELWEKQLGSVCLKGDWVDKCDGKEVINRRVTLDNGDYFIVDDSWCEEC